VRRTLAIALVCAVYAVFGGLILEAYDEFGNQSLLDLAPLVMADRAPLKRRPLEGTDMPPSAGSDPGRATALAPAEHPALSLGQAVSPLAPSLDGGPASEANRLVVMKRPAMAPHDTEPAPAIGATGQENPVAAALETPSLEVRAAVPTGAEGPAVSDRASTPQSAATWPPAPAFKPLDAIPTVMAQAMLPPFAGSRIEMPGLGDRPPRPSLKPVVMTSAQRPEPTAEQDPRRAAAPGPTLPDALRAFWANLKILLAAGPAPRVLRAGRDDRDSSDNQPSVRGDLADASGGDGGTSGGASHSSSDSGNGSSIGGGSGNSAGNSDGGTSAGGGGNGGGPGSGTSTGGSKGDGGRDSGRGGGQDGAGRGGRGDDGRGRGDDGHGRGDDGRGRGDDGRGRGDDGHGHGDDGRGRGDDRGGRGNDRGGGDDDDGGGGDDDD
jgi:hypothetical protein